MYQDFFGKNDDYLNEFKQKVAQQKIATIEEKRAELARSRNSFLGTIAGICLACVVGWFVLAPQYHEQHKEIPIIRRPQTAVKIKPENPGGMEIPNQDKGVYSIVEKKDVDNTVVENLLPTPEQPKLPDIVPDEIPLDENADDLDGIVDEVAQSPNEKTQTAQDEIYDVVLNKPADLLDKEEETESVIQQNETQSTSKASKNADNADNLKATQGSWQIQLIASKNKDAIEKTWQNLSARYTLLKSYAHEVHSADLGGQGMIYKLRAGNFASKSDAQNACNQLKAQGLNDCITKER